jgi:hypothetical protein
MATPRINGTLQPVFKGLRVNFDPTKGFKVAEEWESAGDNLEGLAATAQSAKTPYDYERNALKSRLLISSDGQAYGYGEQITDTWQLLANQIQRDIKDHPTVIAFPSKGNGSLSQTLQFVEDFKEGTPPPDPVSDTDLGGFWSLNQFYLYRLLIHGVTSYTVDQHVVRHTVNVPLAYAGSVAGTAIPALMASTIGAIPINGPNDGAQFKWGWRRTGYQYTVSANNRVEYSVEWALASWSLLIYAAASITGVPA